MAPVMGVKIRGWVMLRPFVELDVDVRVLGPWIGRERHLLRSIRRKCGLGLGIWCSDGHC